jgi:phage terminase large subunit-like protein
VLAADAASAYGLRPHFTIIDELAVWGQTAEPRRLFEALMTAAPKVNGRVLIITSAGDPATWAYDVLEHARRDPLWRVRELEGPPPWLDAAQIESQRRLHSESVYARLYDNRWTASEDRLTTRADVAACMTLCGPLPPIAGTEYVIGVDIGITNDRTAICVCHTEPRREGSEPAFPRVVLDRLDTRTGTRVAPVDLTEVEELIVQLSQIYNRARVVIDPTEAVHMAQRLQRSRGIRVDQFRFSSATVGELATTLYLLLRNRALALPNDEALFTELVNVGLRETSPNVYRLDHDAGRHDDRAIALALAANALLKRSSGSGARLWWLESPQPSRHTIHAARTIAQRIASGY